MQYKFTNQLHIIFFLVNPEIQLLLIATTDDA
jgi:hypothetical protein